MLGLPKATELNKLLPKKAIFASLGLSSLQREKFDGDIGRLYIANEISEKTVNISSGEKIKSIFVLHIILKREGIDKENLTLLSKMIPQNIVFLLAFEERYKLAVFHTKLLTTPWTSEPSLLIQGMNLDIVWEKIIRSVEGGVWNVELSLAENIALHEEQAKIKKKIEALERKLKTTKQFNQQVKIKNEIKGLKLGIRNEE